MCIKIDAAMRIEILPVVYRSGNNDPTNEPFRLYRPETQNWEDGFARYHQQWLAWKNNADKSSGNFIPAIKVLKHMRSHHNVSAVSFHIECLLFALPDALFLGGPADYITRILNASPKPPTSGTRPSSRPPAKIATSSQEASGGWTIGNRFTIPFPSGPPTQISQLTPKRNQRRSFSGSISSVALSEIG